MLLPSGNPFKCHKEVLYLQPTTPPKRFDIFPPDWGMLRRSSSHSFWASSSLDVPAGVTQEKGHSGFFIHLPSAVRALIFLARRIQPFLFLVDRQVEFCLIVFHWLGLFYFIFIFLVRKISFAGIELTSQCVRRLRGYLCVTGAT